MTLPALKIGDSIAKLPIIQGGMSVGISLAGLSSAVANEGGIGVIGTAFIGLNEPDINTNFEEANVRALRREIRKARKMTDGILGVNIMVALTSFGDIVKASIEEGIDIIFSGAGMPLDLPKYVANGAKTKIVPIVSSGRAACLICRKWIGKYNYVPDAIVVEGPKAGGHLGFKPEDLDKSDSALENIIPEVLDAVKIYEEKSKKDIPVIAAGGIYNGDDIRKFLKMGVAGIQMGTRFVATHECDASIKFKQSYIDAKEEDLMIIKSPVGMPGRAIRNEFLKDVEIGKKKPFKCPYHCIKTCDYKKSPYCIAMALYNAQKGRLTRGYAFAGQNAYRVDKIISVKELMTSLVNEYEVASKNDDIRLKKTG